MKHIFVLIGCYDCFHYYNTDLAFEYCCGRDNKCISSLYMGNIGKEDERTEKLIELFENKGCHFNFDDCQRFSLETFSNVVLTYLQYLPTPIVPLEAYSELLNVLDDTSK